MSQTTVPPALEPPPKATTEGAKALKVCSKRELAELVKGEKINIFAGQPPNAAYLFPVPIKLIKYFSPKWKHQLEEENAKVLYLTAHKDAIKLIIEWMLAGGVDSNAKGAIPYPNFDLLKLLSLNKLVTFLEIDFLKNRTLNRIDSITRNQPLSFRQMMQLLSVADIPSETHAVLERNLPRWVAALNGDEWKEKFSRASTHSEQKPAVIILGKIRLAVEENWEKKKPRPSGQKVNGLRHRKLENTQKWIPGLTTATSGSKPKSEAWQQEKRVPTTNANVEPMAMKLTSAVRDNAGTRKERKIAESEYKPRNRRGPTTKPMNALTHDTQIPLK